MYTFCGSGKVLQPPPANRKQNKLYLLPVLDSGAGSAKGFSCELHPWLHLSHLIPGTVRQKLYEKLQLARRFFLLFPSMLTKWAFLKPKKQSESDATYCIQIFCVCVVPNGHLKNKQNKIIAL